MIFGSGLAVARAVVFTSAVAVYLTCKIGHWESLAPWLSMLSILAILLALPGSGRMTKLIALTFLGLGTWFVWRQGISLSKYIRVYGEMMYLLSLFALVPFLAVPIKIGGYRKAIQQVVEQRVKTTAQLNRCITSFSYFLGCFLNLAAVPIMYTGVKPTVESFPVASAKRFATTAILQGYSLPILWTPVSGVVGAVMAITQVGWLSVLPVLLAVSLGCLFLNWMLFHLLEVLRRKTEEPDPRFPSPRKGAEAEEKSSSSAFRLTHIGLAILLFFTLSALLEQWTSVGLVTAVTVLSYPFALLWSLVLRKGSAFFRETASYFAVQIPKMSDQFAVFLSAGFFVKAIQFAGYDHAVNQLFLLWNHTIGVKVFLILLPLVILLFSFAGMHPIVLIALLAESLKPSLLGITSEELTVALVGGAVMTYLVGPFSGTLALMSAMIEVSPFRITRWNALFTAGFFTILAIALLLL
ncbi:hypothetical protein BSNK01_29740 [Bacillaceae bacterium]